MSRNNLSGSRTKVMEIPKFGGQNTAASFSEIDLSQSPKMLNALPNALGALGKRPGTIPLSNTSLGDIKVITSLFKDNVNNILVVSGGKFYKFADGNFTEQTMTATLKTSSVDTAQFKDANGQEVLIITDGGNLKYYDGTSVKDITPAANDASPLPPNDLANLNTQHPAKGCLIHNTRVVLWDNSDTIWHSKIGYFDYFPNVDYQRFVRENDYVQTCITYRGALLVLMRRHIGVLFGHDRDDWRQDFLDTTDGCLAARSVQTVTYPDGNQEVFYVSDNGVHAVYAIDTLSLDSSARYSTRNVSNRDIDWQGLGVTVDEWRNAIAHFHNGQYWLIYKKGTEYHGLVYDTHIKQWYPVKNIKAVNFYDDENHLYYVGPEGHVKVMDDNLYSDWDDKAKTIGTPIDFHWYSKMMTPKLTGFDHFWDILMVEAKQFPVQSSVDVEVNTYKDQYSAPSALKTAVFVWGQTKWGESQFANPKLTDDVNNAKRLRTFVKGQYAQVKLANDRDEPVQIYGLRYEVRPMDTYY